MRFVIITMLASALAGEHIAPGIERISSAEGLPSKYPYRLAHVQGSLWTTMRAFDGPFRIAGIARVSHERITAYSVSNGLRSDAVQAVTSHDGTLFAATDKGLCRFVSNSFEALGPAVALTHLASGGGLWAFGSGDDRSYAVIVREGKTAVLSMKKRVRPLALAVMSADTAWLVHQGGIIVISGGAMKDMPLEGTPLWKKPNRDPDGPVPSVVLYAAVSSRSSLYVVGHTKALIRYDNGWSTVTNGHFGRLAAGGDNVFVSDFAGSIFQYDGTSCAPIFSGAISIGAISADSRGTLWAEADMKRNEPHVLIRFDAPYAREARRYSLAAGTALSPGICDMLTDENGALWLATNDGLWKIQ